MKHKVYRLTYILIVFCVIIPVKIIAQDASFSQNYASPLYLSPSFTGLTEGSRLAFNYRDQWPNIPNTYRTMMFALDHYFSDYNSGVGLLYYRDDQGEGLLVDQNVGVLYSYEINISNKIMVRPGIHFKFAQTMIDPTKGNLSSNLSRETGQQISGSGIALAREQTNKFDAASSLMIYSNIYWGGITIDHLVKSNVGLTDIETYRGTKLTAFAGYKWVYKPGRRGMADQSVSFAVNYRKQQVFNQLDFGAYWVYNPIELGLWYRGIPGNNVEGLPNTDALVAILGVHFGNTRIGYSFDLTVSELGYNSGGAHEISIMHTIPSSTRPRRINRSAIPCSVPGYSGGGASRSKYRSRKRSIF
jgi:type IX secretion system PorP/SprF family membrane protein